MTSKPPLIAIVGRPNVGKSTLFNRLIGRRHAIVHDEPGVTRDRNYAVGDWAGRVFRVVDTGGYEVEPHSDLFAQMRRQVEEALREADGVILVVDGRAGIHPDDREMALKLRRSGKNVFLAVNKIDTSLQDANLAEFFELGFEKTFPVSAEHGRGVAELLEEVTGGGDFPRGSFKAEAPKEESSKDENRIIRIAILGRPNVGKSTLLNRLYGAPRSVVHPKPGTTRDSVDIEIESNGRRFQIIDTAGIRKKSHSEGKIEKVSVVKAFDTVEKSDVVLLLVDAEDPLTAQDAKVVQHALKRKRPVLILVNKWDRVAEKTSWDDLRKDFQDRFEFLKFVPAYPISAKTGGGLKRLFFEVLKVYGEYSKRLSTSQLNKVFRELLDSNPPPTVSGKSLNLFYMKQNSTQPPHFVIFANHPKLVPEHYRRYLLRGLREAFSFRGTPLELEFKARKKRPFHA